MNKHWCERFVRGIGSVFGWSVAGLICIELMVALAGAGSARAQGGPYATARLISAFSVVPEDSRSFRAALELRMEDGWHVYWRNPGDSGLPPTVEWNDATPQTSQFEWPLPHEQPLGGLMNYGYEGVLVLPFEVHLAVDADRSVLRLEGMAEWLICKDICLPESAPVGLTLPVGGSGQVDDQASEAIARALDAVPQEFEGQARIEATVDGLWRLSVTDPDLADARWLRFFPDGHRISHAAAQRGFRGSQGVSVDLTPLTLAAPVPDTLTGVLAVESDGKGRFGVRLAAVDGVFLPGTRQVPLNPVTGASGVVSGSSVSILLMLLMAFIGGLVLNLMPCVLPVLAVKAASLAGSARKDAGVVRAESMAWTAGVLVCFLAIGVVLLVARSIGEQVGVGFQLQYPQVTAGLALLMFVIGLNLLGVFEIGSLSSGSMDRLADSGGRIGAFFTGVLAAFVGAPCVGPLLGAAMASVLTHGPLTVMAVFATMGLGMALPVGLIGIRPHLARVIPRPGPWMVPFRQFLAFPMFLAMIWLLWVLAGQTGSDGVVGILVASVLLAFGLWVMRVLSGKVRLIAVPVLVVALVLGISGVSGAARVGVVVSGPDTAQWSPERIARLRASGSAVLVDFTARWCITCQVNKRTTLESPEVLEALASSGVTLLTADWTSRDPVIAAELAVHGRVGVPLYLLYPKGGGEPEILPQILTPDLVVDSIRRAVDSGGMQLGS